MFRKFAIGSIFEKVPCPIVGLDTDDFRAKRSQEFRIPLISTVGERMIGIAGYARRSACRPPARDVIAVCASGKGAGGCFYYPGRIAVSPDFYAVKLKGGDICSYPEGLFLATALELALFNGKAKQNGAAWENIKNVYVELPVIDRELKGYLYSASDIDACFMASTMPELTKELVREGGILT